MEGPIAVHSQIRCQSGKREAFLESMIPLVEQSKKDPAVLAYFVATPVKDESETEVLTFALYKSREAFEAHTSNTGIKDIWDNASAFLKEQPVVKHGTPIANSFIRSDVKAQLGFVIHANMVYSEEANMDEVIPKLSGLIQYCKSEEPQTQGYYWAVEEGNPRSILMFEQFHSSEFCFETHMKSKVFAEALTYQVDGLQTQPAFVQQRMGFNRS